MQAQQVRLVGDGHAHAPMRLYKRHGRSPFAVHGYPHPAHDPAGPAEPPVARVMLHITHTTYSTPPLLEAAPMCTVTSKGALSAAASAVTPTTAQTLVASSLSPPTMYPGPSSMTSQVAVLPPLASTATEKPFG